MVTDQHRCNSPALHVGWHLDRCVDSVEIPTTLRVNDVAA
jgi:hypothetical protein